MVLKVVSQFSLLIEEAMCFQSCGLTIENGLKTILQEKLGTSCNITISSQPRALGIHQLDVIIQSETTPEVDAKFIEELQTQLCETTGFPVTSLNSLKEKQPSPESFVNQLNIVINIIAILGIIILSILLPPSILLNISLSIICFATTLFTAREYIFNFLKNLKNKKFEIMPASVSLAWILSLAHTIYHLEFMPTIQSLSSTFMIFGMPLILVTIINIMDEIKRLIKNKSKKITLNGLNTLFPEMQDKYLVHNLNENELAIIHKQNKENINLLLNKKTTSFCQWQLLQKNMLITVKHGECFPVDGTIIHGHTFVDTSIINGEPTALKKTFTEVYSGCINLGDDVIILAQANSYNSTTNKMLYCANIKDEITNQLNSYGPQNNINQFYYFYFTLFAVGLIVSISIAFALNLFSIALLLQTTTGLLFAICPCTIAIAHYLPKLLADFSLDQQGFIHKKEQNEQKLQNIEVIIFDKTGTLTTANSKVHSSTEFSNELWEKIYLIEAKYGGVHPIARAIRNYAKQQVPNIQNYPIEQNCIATNGVSAKINNDIIYIGNKDFLKQNNINITNIDTLEAMTHVHIAVNNDYKGKILIQHELRPNIDSALKKLKDSGKKLIILTGDSEKSAIGFNKQLNQPFDEENIFTSQTPEQKKDTIKKLIKKYGANKMCFIGDGLNDASCSRTLSNAGGISMAITSNEKAAFFTDICLNSTLDYLFFYNDILQEINNITKQNQLILALGATALLTLLIISPIIGMNISMLIPTIIMLSTTICVVLNSYRAKTRTDNFFKPTKNINNKNNETINFSPDLTRLSTAVSYK